MTLVHFLALSLVAGLTVMDLVRVERPAPLAPARPRPSSNERCPYCHEAFDAAEILARCHSCQTRHHLECWSEHARCSVHGCAGDAGEPVASEVRPDAIEHPSGAPAG
jgi:hypothetical protein